MEATITSEVTVRVFQSGTNDELEVVEAEYDGDTLTVHTEGQEGTLVSESYFNNTFTVNVYSADGCKEYEVIAVDANFDGEEINVNIRDLEPEKIIIDDALNINDIITSLSRATGWSRESQNLLMAEYIGRMGLRNSFISFLTDKCRRDLQSEEI
jgi:hypothetical protein